MFFLVYHICIIESGHEPGSGVQYTPLYEQLHGAFSMLCSTRLVVQSC